MAVPTERSENVAFPRPLPRPTVFAWATWIATCGLGYWIYVQAAADDVSIALSVAFWMVAVLVIPAIIVRGRDRIAGLIAATVTMLTYALLMQAAIK